MISYVVNKPEEKKEVTPAIKTDTKKTDTKKEIKKQK